MKLTVSEKAREQILTKKLGELYTQKDIARDINCNKKSIGAAFRQMLERKEHEIVSPYTIESKVIYGVIDATSCHIYQRLKEYEIRIPKPKKLKPKVKIKIDTSSLMYTFAYGGDPDIIRGNLI